MFGATIKIMLNVIAFLLSWENVMKNILQNNILLQGYLYVKSVIYIGNFQFHYLLTSLKK